MDIPLNHTYTFLQGVWCPLQVWGTTAFSLNNKVIINSYFIEFKSYNILIKVCKVYFSSTEHL